MIIDIELCVPDERQSESLRTVTPTIYIIYNGRLSNYLFTYIHFRNFYNHMHGKRYKSLSAGKLLPDEAVASRPPSVASFTYPLCLGLFFLLIERRVYMLLNVYSNTTPNIDIELQTRLQRVIRRLLL